MTAEEQVGIQVKAPPPQRIRTTWHARAARREARLALLRRHDWTLHVLRHRLMATGWDGGEGNAITAAVNHHLDRMEYHLDMIEAGR